MNARSQFSQSAIPNGHNACVPTKKTVVREKKKCFLCIVYSPVYRSMPEGLILSQTSAFRLLPPFWYHGRIYAII